MFFGFRLTETGDPLYSHQLRWHNTSRIRSYFSDEFNSGIAAYDPIADVYPMLPESFSSWGDLEQSQYLEATIFMSSYLLSSQGDRMAMGNSVEGRYPFLDYRVIEFCSTLPDHFKLNGLEEKYLLKQAVKGMIPESILKRHKQAYRAPIAMSFFSPTAPSYVIQMLSPDSVRATGIFHEQRVQQLIDKIKSGQNYSEVDQMALAGILSTQLLHHRFLASPMPDNSPLLNDCRIIEEK